jgi:lantibiotic leader peptide-processing serine protease
MRRRYLGAALALALATALGVVALAPSAGAGTTRTYVVLYKQLAVTGDAAARVQAAGGTLVASYPQIGVTIARSSNDGFAATMKKDLRIQGVSATDRFGVRLPDSADDQSAVMDAASVAAATTSSTDWGDPLSVEQWDMVQIHVPEAHAIQAGSPDVVVGDIDTGLDFTHPDLAPNYDAASSTDCTSGAPAPLLPGNDVDGHGTHTAGTIAAAANGIGIVGVAPNVKIAGIRASGIAPDGSTGFFFPEAVVCSFMWAATHDIDVTNNSYFADPWLFNCKNDPEQRAIWNAERRAISFAQSRGVLVVAAAGNENIDLSKTNVDTISPDFPPGTAQERLVTNACSVVPVEVPGVVGVSGVGYLRQKAYFSTYGMGVINVTAPSGDRRFQMPPTPSGNGRVLSTVPGGYEFLQGTSMAAPHVVGVAALILSQYPGMSRAAVAAMLQNTADSLACPPNPFNPGPPFDFLAICTGGPAYNSFFGHGEVNALTAVGG